MSIDIDHPNEDISTSSGAQPTLGGLDIGTTGTWTPVVTAATPGDLSVSYSIQTGRWMKLGSRYFFEIIIVFTPTYTTASGALYVSNAFTASQVTRGAVGYSSNVTFGGTTVLLGWRARSSDSNFDFTESSSGASPTDLAITSVPSGTAAALVFQGQFEV